MIKWIQKIVRRLCRPVSPKPADPPNSLNELQHVLIKKVETAFAKKVMGKIGIAAHGFAAQCGPVAPNPAAQLNTATAGFGETGLPITVLVYYPLTCSGLVLTSICRHRSLSDALECVAGLRRRLPAEAYVTVCTGWRSPMENPTHVFRPELN